MDKLKTKTVNNILVKNKDHISRSENNLILENNLTTPT